MLQIDCNLVLLYIMNYSFYFQCYLVSKLHPEQASSILWVFHVEHPAWQLEHPLKVFHVEHPHHHFTLVFLSDLLAETSCITFLMPQYEPMIDDQLYIWYKIFFANNLYMLLINNTESYGIIRIKIRSKRVVGPDSKHPGLALTTLANSWSYRKPSPRHQKRAFGIMPSPLKKLFQSSASLNQ
jgi:hypothetical protein